MSKILIVDDEQGIRDVLAQILEEEGHEVFLAENGAQGRQRCAEHAPDLVLLDIWMPDLDGLSLIKEWASQGRLTRPVVMMSGHGTIQHAIEATRLGAFAFLEKPISFKPLIETVARALASAHSAPERQAHIEGLGDSESIEVLENSLRRAKDSGAPIFLASEPGAGAEACARFLHAHGTPWLAPEQMGPLADNTLQWLEQAKGGVLFLQGIEHLSPTQQRGLLLLIARRQEFSVRVICTSAESLATKEGYSRDLYNALIKAAVRVPALRDHPEDIPQIANRLLAEICARHGLPLRQLSEEAMDIVVAQHWPGNLDELASVLEALALAARGDMIEAGEVEVRLGLRVQGGGELDRLFDLPLKDARNAFERIYLEAVLKRCKGSVSRAAEVSGIERTHLYRVLRKLGLRAGAEES